MNKVTNEAVIQPGDWLGMIGGGQLGRMFCHAAQSMGYKVAVLDPDANSPAGAVADKHIRAAYDDEEGLRALSAQCKAITTEFENVPAASLQFLEQGSRVTPSSSAVAVVQDRIAEKAFIVSAGVPVAPYAPIQNKADLQNADAALFPGILKAARLGYDGKGQARVSSREEALVAFEQFGEVACVLEALQPLKDEISVVMARSLQGDVAAFVPSHNEHRDGVLAVSTAASASLPVYQQAIAAAEKIAQALGYYGVFCVEFFILQDGSLIANEVAPRPHNSGHFTMDACVTSQFAQQARVMAGLPLGAPTSHSHSVMLNLLGDLWFDEQGTYREPDWAGVLAVPGACLHLYGKAEARKGRKMGHINVVGSTLIEAQQRAAQAAAPIGFVYHA